MLVSHHGFECPREQEGERPGTSWPAPQIPGGPLPAFHLRPVDRNPHRCSQHKPSSPTGPPFRGGYIKCHGTRRGPRDVEPVAARLPSWRRSGNSLCPSSATDEGTKAPCSPSARTPPGAGARPGSRSATLRRPGSPGWPAAGRRRPPPPCGWPANDIHGGRRQPTARPRQRSHWRPLGAPRQVRPRARGPAVPNTSILKVPSPPRNESQVGPHAPSSLHLPQGAGWEGRGISGTAAQCCRQRASLTATGHPSPLQLPHTSLPGSPHCTHQNPVEGRRRPAPLHVSQDGHAGVISQLRHHQLRTARAGRSAPARGRAAS